MKEIWARILFQDKPELQDIAQNEREHFFQSKLVLSDKFKVEIEMVVYGGNKVGLVSYDEEIAIIIESQKIHDTQKSFFEVVWDLTNKPSGQSAE